MFSTHESSPLPLDVHGQDIQQYRAWNSRFLFPHKQGLFTIDCEDEKRGMAKIKIRTIELRYGRVG
jgi:hypothetical protein